VFDKPASSVSDDKKVLQLCRQWRRACGLTPFESWADMVQATSPQSVDHLSSVYEEVDDVDLFTGDVMLLVHWVQPILYVGAGNTKGGSIPVPLTSCLTGWESAV
jgi:hypothetical protein